ncbi:hypothetical protein [Nakamurella aerolata]|uniref:Flagellar basal body-associated protein FliL n=1 Tax=Nakamurella aerolata TaxID=1656892 RepID=A0A849A5L3_9ACTN|nr:hypothetical protein [Nakamurella aerolata]NNG34311.1 hypothetical protein [Nakamurella aerolata]
MSDNYGPQGQGGWQPGPEGQGQGWQPQGQGQQQWGPGQPQGQQPGQFPAGGQQGWQQGAPEQAGGGQQGQQGWQPQGQQGWQGGPAGWQGQQQPPKKNRTGIIVTALVLVAALVGGGIWFFGFRDKDGSDSTASGGTDSPALAAQNFATALEKGDTVGIADQLDPAEAKLFDDISGDMLKTLKRLQIVKDSVQTNNLTSSSIEIKGLKFDEAKAEQINDRVSIQKLTAGTITVKGSSEFPFTDKIKKALGPELERAQQNQPKSQTVNIADLVKKTGGPVRVATVKRGDKWYPSMFYTLADNMLQKAANNNGKKLSTDLGKPIPNAGAGSPEEAVQSLVSKSLSRDAEGVISLLDPVEMGVMHDYGPKLLEATDYPGPQASGVKVDGLQLNTTQVTGGTKVSLKHATVTANGMTVEITVDGDKLSVTANGQTRTMTPDMLLQMASGSSPGSSGSMSAQLPPAIQTVIQKEFKALLNIGIVTTQVDGKWYVSPVRSFSGVFLDMLNALDASDVDALLQLAGK